MARPVVSDIAEELYEILSPVAYADESLGWPLLKFCESQAGGIQEVWELIGRYVVASREYSNELINPSFELPLTTWGPYQDAGTGTITQSNEVDGVSGQYVCKLTATSAGVNLGVVTIQPGYIPVVPGEQWIMRGRTQAKTTVRQARMAYAFWNSAFGLVTSGLGTAVTNKAGVWTVNPSLAVTVPANAAYMSVYVALDALANGEVHYADAVEAKKGTSFPDSEFHTGDDPGYEWEGTPHASKTIRHVKGSPADGYVPWSGIVDVNRAPYKALPWLGQLVGVDTPNIVTGESSLAHESRIRELVRATPGFKRGSPAAIEAAVSQYLTGTKTVIVRERNGSAYQLQVLTKRDETPTEDWGATNLILYSSVEGNPGPHTAINGATLGHNGIPNIPVAHGVWGMVVNCPQGAVHSGVKFNGAPIVVSPNQWYTISAWIQMIAGRQYYLYIDHHAGVGGSILQTSTGTFTADGTLTRKSFTFKSDVGAGSVSAYLLRTVADSASGGLQNIIWDAVQLEQNKIATPYIFTGATTVTRAVGSGSVGRALASQKPGGIILTYTILDGQDYQQLFTGFATYQTVFTTYTTYEGVFSGTPGT